MFGLIKKIFIGLITAIVSTSNHIKFMLLSNQHFMIPPTPISLHPNEYSQEFHYYPFAVKLDRCVGSCNTLNDLSNKVCVPNKTENVNVNLMKENVIQIYDEITMNVDVSVKNVMYMKKIMFGILLYVVVKMEKYLASIMDYSAIMCDEVMESYDEETKTIPTNFNEKKEIRKTQNFHIFHVFSLITIALLIAAGIYCYLIK